MSVTPRVLTELSASRAAAWYVRMFTQGRHRQPPSSSPSRIVENFRDRDRRWVLVMIPLRMLNYTTMSQANDTRIQLAKDYARRGGEFPPGIGMYERDRGRRSSRIWVQDGNHRALAAQIRGKHTMRMLMPENEFRAFLFDQGARR